MPPRSRAPPPTPDNSIYVARIARGKIYAEFRRADPNLRLCVGHANMLDRINDHALKAATQRVIQSQSKSQRSKRHGVITETTKDTNPKIKDVSDEYIPLSRRPAHSSEISVRERKDMDEGDLSLSAHFSAFGTEVVDDDTDSSSSESESDYSPPPTPVTVSVACVEIQDDEYDDFGLPPRPVRDAKGYVEHAPPLLTAIAKVQDANYSSTTGMLATLSMSEELAVEFWEE